MKIKPILTLAVLVVLLQACSSSTNSPLAVDAPPATNPGGGIVTAAMTALFVIDRAEPDNTRIPLPNNLLLAGTTDLTLNIPVPDPTDFSNPRVALNALGGWSTVAPWGAGFSADVAASSVTPSSVRLYNVELTRPGGAVETVVSELVFGVDYVAVANGSSVNIVPLKPLTQLTSYMAVLTNGITDGEGNIATPDQTYFIAQRTSPLIDAAGNSTDPLIPDVNAQGLEPLRQLVNAQENAAASQGVSRDTIVLSWVMSTQSITPVLAAVKSISGPGASTIGPTGLTTAAVGGVGIADIYVGTMTTPYYLEAPSAANPLAALNRFWKAAPGGYVSPFNAFGLDPTSTNITYANPIPVATGVQNIPVLMTVPNAGSGMAKPAAGWPIMIFQHGITRQRTDMLAVADTMASIGYAVVAIDMPLHGIVDITNPFYIENTPFAPVSNERTFDMDLIDNETRAPGPDGIIDPSATHFINLAHLLVTRDNSRQGSADLFTLTETIPLMDIDGDAAGDFNGASIVYTGMSMGSMVGINYLAMGPNIQSAVLSVPGGGITNLLLGSEAFGPTILAGLAAAGLTPGTADFNSFTVAAQTVIDASDPVNFGAFATAINNVLLHEVLGDSVIPNSVAGAPLSGTDPLIAAMGLTQYSATAADAGGIDGVVKFTEAVHGSLLNPTVSPASTAEMQSQMAAFHASSGTTVLITNTDVVE